MKYKENIMKISKCKPGAYQTKGISVFIPKNLNLRELPGSVRTGGSVYSPETTHAFLFLGGVNGIERNLERHFNWLGCSYYRSFLGLVHTLLNIGVKAIQESGRRWDRAILTYSPILDRAVSDG